MSMCRLDWSLVPLALDAAPAIVHEHLAVQTTIAAIAAVALHDPALFLESIQDQFLEHQGIECTQVRHAPGEGFSSIGTDDLG